VEELTSGAGAADPGIVSTMGDTPTPTTTGTTPAPTEQPAGTASAGADQGTATQTATTEDDILAGVPSLDELNQLDDNLQYKKSLVQMRQAIEENFKPKLNEFTERMKVFEPIQDRFQTPEEVQQAVEWHDKLFGSYERVDGQLVPATEKVAQELAQRDPAVADYLASDLMNGLTRTDDGREVSRFDLALEEIGRNPELKERRAAALKLLGGVEPTSIAPTWQPTAEELEVVRPELQDIYKQLPYDERESLKLNDPQFINKYLADQKFKQDLIEENRTAKDLQTRQQEQREQHIRQQAEEAGHKAVEEGFRQLFTEYRDNVVESSKFIAPLDPQSPEAQEMEPEAVAQFNQKAQQINAGVGNFVALVTAALSVPDTSWLAQDVLKRLGVTDEILQKFNAARQEYANNTRDAGQLGYGQNGNVPGGLGTLQSNARRAASNLKGNGNAITKAVKALLSDFFEMKAGNYNSTLNGAATVRPPVNGTGFNPATAPAQRPPAGTYSRKEIDAMFG
jgi:hypothetical protein